MDLTWFLRSVASIVSFPKANKTTFKNKVVFFCKNCCYPSFFIIHFCTRKFHGKERIGGWKSLNFNNSRSHVGCNVFFAFIIIILCVNFSSGTNSVETSDRIYPTQPSIYPLHIHTYVHGLASKQDLWSFVFFSLLPRILWVTISKRKLFLLTPHIFLQWQEKWKRKKTNCNKEED